MDSIKKRKTAKTEKYLLPLAESREKSCPFHGKDCRGDNCMAWEWVDLETLEKCTINCEALYKQRNKKACLGECEGCEYRVGWCRAI